MRIISRKTLRDFWKKNPEAEHQLRAWFAEAKKAKWRTPNDVLARYTTADIVGNKRIVFNICRNKYRLVVRVNYDFGRIWIRFIGTHKDYDEIDVRTI